MSCRKLIQESVCERTKSPRSKSSRARASPLSRSAAVTLTPSRPYSSAMRRKLGMTRVPPASKRTVVIMGSERRKARVGDVGLDGRAAPLSFGVGAHGVRRDLVGGDEAHQHEGELRVGDAPG